MHGPGQRGRLGVDAGAAAERRKSQVAHGQGHEVGRNGLRHMKPVAAVGGEAPGVFGTHERQQVRRHAHRGLVGEADARRVLARQPGARQNGLRLREQERLRTGRLGRGQPLQSGRGGRRAVRNAHGRAARRQAHAQGLAQHRVGGAEGVSGRCLGAGAVHSFDRSDGQVAHVENDFGPGTGVGQLPGGGAGQFTPVEINHEVERQVAHPHRAGTGVAVRVGGRRNGRE